MAEAIARLASGNRRERLGAAQKVSVAVFTELFRFNNVAPHRARLRWMALEETGAVAAWLAVSVFAIDRIRSAWEDAAHLLARALHKKVKSAPRIALLCGLEKIDDAKRAQLLVPLLPFATTRELNSLAAQFATSPTTAAKLVRLLERSLRGSPRDRDAESALEKLLSVKTAESRALSALERLYRKGVRHGVAEALSRHYAKIGKEPALEDARPPGLDAFWPIPLRRRATYGIAGRHLRIVDAMVPPWCAECGGRDGGFTFYECSAGAGGYLIEAEVECRACGTFSLYGYNDTTSPRW